MIKELRMAKTPAKIRAEKYIELVNQGMTYAQVADFCNSTRNAVRESIRRYKANQRYSGDDVAPTSEAESELVQSGVEIWNVDIERVPRIEYSWSARKRDSYTPESFMIQDSRMVSFAAKALGKSPIFSSEYHHGSENMLNTLWHVMDRADVIVSWNGRRFDIPHINGAFRDAGMRPPKPFKQIDVMQQVRRQFNYDYNTLKSVVKRWGLDEEKMETEGFELWKKIMAGEQEAWDTMRKYNMQDVRTCEAAFLSNLAWMTSSIPNLAIWVDSDEPICPVCTSTDVVEDGVAATNTTLYKGYLCNKCGFRSRSNDKVGTSKLRTVTL